MSEALAGIIFVAGLIAISAADVTLYIGVAKRQRRQQKQIDDYVGFAEDIADAETDIEILESIVEKLCPHEEWEAGGIDVPATIAIRGTDHYIGQATALCKTCKLCGREVRIDRNEHQELKKTQEMAEIEAKRKELTERKRELSKSK